MAMALGHLTITLTVNTAIDVRPDELLVMVAGASSGWQRWMTVRRDSVKCVQRLVPAHLRYFQLMGMTDPSTYVLARRKQDS